MLYPAQLYKDELKRKMTSCWYKAKYQYFFDGWYQEWEISNDGNSFREFVHLDKDDNIDGYFGHRYNQVAQSLRDFGLVNFTEKINMKFIKDVIEYILEMFINGVQRVEFWAFIDNPAYNGYQKLIKRFGGTQVAYLTRSSFFNGQYRDAVIFEILRENLVVKKHNQVFTIDNLSDYFKMK
jgi:RimJ/RimL family protein N-acetyltransferase